MLSFSAVFTTECCCGRSSLPSKKLFNFYFTSSISLQKLICFDFDLNQSQRTQTDIQKWL